MSINFTQTTLTKENDRKVRDLLYDKLTLHGLDTYTDQIYKRIVNWKGEKQSRIKRLFWCLSVLHTENELKQMIKNRIGFFNIEGFNQEIIIDGNSVDHHEANWCDVFLFPTLNLSYGEEFDIYHFDTREEAWAFGNDLGHSQWVDQPGENGDWDVIIDHNPND